MTFDQAQSARLGQRVAPESTYVRIFTGAEIPEAAWPGQLIFRSDQQILQIFNGASWEDISPSGNLTTVKGEPPPVAETVGDTWINTDDGNRIYVAKSAGADEITEGEWELISSAAPPITETTHVYQKSTPPGASDVPPPKDNDFWYELPEMKQYFYDADAPGTHWVAVYSSATADAAIVSTTLEYSLSASETVPPDTGWTVVPPTRVPGTFIWVRTVNVHGDDTVTTSFPALMTGNTGATGPAGPTGSQGIPGPTGPTGQQLYTWVKYADTPTSGMDDFPAGKNYMGLAYNKTIPTESNVYTDYAWSLTKGEDGTDGAQGVQGPPGANGQPTYTWIRYADSITGTGMSNSSVGKTHLGIAYNKTTATESDVPGDYEWSLIQGPQGVQGQQGSQGVPGPAGANGQSLFTWIQYADSTTPIPTAIYDTPAGHVYMGIAYNKASQTESSVYTDYAWSLIQGEDGADGAQGVPGVPGADGAPRYTWIKYADDASGNGISNDPTGKKYMGITYNQLSATETNNPTPPYEWSLIQGPQGPTGGTGPQGPGGAQGVSVLSITPFYAQVTTASSAPAMPGNVATPPYPWQLTEPGYAPGTKLYTTDRVAYSDGAHVYTTVVLSSAYTASSTKTQVFRANGFDATGLPPLIPIPGITVGDIWYQTDDHNRMWFYDGGGVNGGWVDAHDPNIQTALDGTETNAAELEKTDYAVRQNALTATSANNSADTADGRVSMSDYEPGADDIVYASTQPILDPETGIISYVEVITPRVNGSIWYVRTRPRRNLCTNPSVEVDVVGWTVTACTAVRDATIGGPAGDYTLKVTNSGAVDHKVTWGATTRVPCVEGEKFTASIFAELISGTSPEAVHLDLKWANSGGTVIGTTTGTPGALILDLNAFTLANAGTINEPRSWVTGTAPAGAVSFYAEVVSGAPNASAVWHTAELLIEKQDDVGRYFDGSTDEGFWEGAAHASISGLHGDKIQQIWELRDSNWIRKYFTDSTLDTINAAKLVGTTNASVITDNTMAPDKLVAAAVLAQENLAAGDLVHVYFDSGVFRARKARAGPVTPYEAHGFVWEAVTAGQYAKVRHVGYVSTLSGLAPGPQWLSEVPGKISSFPPALIGQLVQQVGFAPMASVLNFQPLSTIKII